MKRLGLLVSLVLLSVVGTTTTTRAYYLDTPHNESNGIYCFTCHYKQPLWRTWTATADPDYTLRNAICLECHTQGSSHVNAGPAKVAHSSANTTVAQGIWTTECTQCHDVHSQGQLDYAVDDSAELFLATGSFDTSTNSLTPWPNDADGGVCNNVVQGPVGTLCGTTTVGISPVITAAPDPVVDWSVTANWGNKGGMGSPGRGLVLVPNKSNPSETFEIISVTSNVIKVKGRMTTAVGNGQVFGVIYGQSIKSFIMPNGGTTINDLRDVKFFKPGLIAGGAGGYVDLTPGETAPKGLCQACHVSTVNWTSDGTNNDHNPDQPCGGCHILSTGGGNEVIKDHTTYISDTSVGTICLPCHAAENGDPDSSHAAGCSTCHTMGSPTLALNTLNTNQIVNEAVGVTPLDSLLAAFYTYNIFAPYTVPRLQDSDGTDIQPIAHGGDAVFDKIGCDICHPSKPGMVGDGSHGGHPDSPLVFVWDQVCRDCHDPTSAVNGYKDIHGNGTVATCSLCHAQPGIDDGTYFPRRAGTDGTAVDMLTSSTCTDCHLFAGNTSGAIHHDSVNTCTVCHVQGQSHGGNHTGLVGAYANCTGCHAANEGYATGTPVDPFTATVHDSCITCHKLVGGNVLLKTKAGDYPVSTKIIDIPDGGAGSNNGGGTCVACHGEYFASHSNASHTTLVSLPANCADCHNGAQGNATTVPISSGDNKIHDTCYTCHATNGLLLTLVAADTHNSPDWVSAMPAGAAGTNNGGGSCEACHTLGFNTYHQTVVHTVMVSNHSTCSSCHTATGSTVAPADPKVHDACGQCHGANGRLLGSGATHYGAGYGGTDGGGNCTICHGAYFNSHNNASHLTLVGPTATCTTSPCHNTVTQGTATTVPISGADARVHDACTTCHSATTGLLLAGPIGTAALMPAGAAGTNNGGGICTACHSTYTLDNHIHTHDLTYSATTDKSQENPGTACGVCHVPTGLLTTWTGILNEHTGGCARCHSYSSGTDPVVATNNSVITSGTAVKCLTCHVAKAAPATHGGHDETHFPWDATTITSCGASGCHNSATDINVVSQVHDNICTICHTGTPTRDNEILGAATFGIDGDARLANGTAAAATWSSINCLTCHPTGTYDNSTVHHDTKTGYADADNCTFCHTGTNYPGDHTALVSMAANCADCHGGATGLSNGIPVGTGDNKIHDTCMDCHNADDTASMKAFYGVAQANPAGAAGSNNGGGSCVTCHTLGFTGFHTTSVPHTTMVASATACSSCHTLSGNAVNASDPMVHDACTSCHLSTTGRLTGTGSANIGAGYGGTDGGGACTVCHGAYFNSHVNASHLTLVGPTATCTTSPCHNTVTQGTATSVPVSGADHRVHDACTTCHSATNGLLLTGPIGTAALMPAGLAGTNNGGGTCTDCHSTYTLDNHIHHNSYNQVTYNAGTDLSQAGPGTPCADCHVPSGLLTTWTGILNEHTGGCARCHSYSSGTDPVVATNTSRIATDATSTCISCHVAKVQPATHGGHDPAHFPWDATTITSCGASGCHNSATNTDVVLQVHGNDCAMCHSGSPTRDNEILGAATFGVDGDARLANGTAAAATWSSINCLTCHPTATYDVSTVHHETKNNYADVDNCTICHTGATYGGNHTTLVSMAANCADCHGGATGVSTGIPVGTGDNRIHDTCMDCHNADNDATMKAPYGVAQANPAGAAGSNNGGGSCTTCHTSGFTGFHTTSVPHTTMVASATACSSCHTLSGNATNASDPMVHDACTSCHLSTTGRLTGTGSANIGAGYGGTDGGGACTVCHGAYFNSHINASHLTLVAPVATCTTSPCHFSVTQGTATSVPVVPGDARIHDACTTCHSGTTGLLLGGPIGSAALMPAGAAGTNNGGGTCTACHSTYTLDNHVHTHDVSYNATTDLSQAAPGTPCAGCHVPSGLLTTWTGILNEHTGGCARCHSYSSGTDPVVATNTSVIATGTAVKCLTCHVAKVQPNTHGGHATNAFDWTTATKASCGTSDCHDWTNNPNVVIDIHGSGSATTGILGSSGYRHYGNACRNCHSVNGGGDGNTIGGNAVNGFTGDARIVANGGPASATTHTEACTTCHTLTIPRIHHERWMSDPAGRNVTPTRPSWVLSGNCYKCHNDTNYVTAGLKATFEPEGPARSQVMHGSTNVTEKRPGITPCAYCHIENTTGASGVFRIKKYDIARIQSPNSTASLEALNPATGLYTHSIPNRGTAIAVKNSGNCLHCHGATNNRPANYVSAPGLTAVKPRHAWVVGMITSTNENTTAGIIRLRVGLHPGHIKYRLMSTQPNPAGNLGTAGWSIADRYSKAGTYNVKLYAGLGSQSVGKASGTITGPLFQAQWGVSNLKALPGSAFLAGGAYPPVATQSVPYTINGDSGGPYVVPINP